MELLFCVCVQAFHDTQMLKAMKKEIVDNVAQRLQVRSYNVASNDKTVLTLQSQI